jgi:hypothetical protein
MTSKLKIVKLQTAKMMLLLIFFLVSACSPYKYATRASKSAQKAMQADKAWERGEVKK